MADAAVDGGAPTADACTPDPFCAGKTAGNYCDGNGTRTCTLVGGCLKASAVVACAGASTCSAGACTCPVNACQPAGTPNSGTPNVSVCTGNGYSMCGATDAGGCIAPAAAQPTDCGSLTCKPGAAAAADACVCPAVAGTAGPNGGVGCETVNAQICSTPNADGLTNVLICASASVAGPGETTKSCNVWQIFGGTQESGNCVAAGVSCSTVTHTCLCPDEAGRTTFFANPLEDRTLLNSRSISTSGMQKPAVCAFETFKRALSRAEATVSQTSGSANRVYVVLSGGDFVNGTPAVFASEPQSGDNPTFPATIPDRIVVTVDTDVRVPGIDLTEGKTPDPRSHVLVVNADTDGLLLTGSNAADTTVYGGQVHGFTVIGGDCTANGGHCSPHAAIRMTGYGQNAIVSGEPRARIDEMWVEGAGGPVVASQTGVNVTYTAGTDRVAANGTLTFSVTSDKLAANTSYYVALNSATAGFSGYYFIDGAHGGIVAGTGTNVYNITVSTNGKGIAAATATATATVNSLGGFANGIVVTGSNGTISNVIVENFVRGDGVFVESTFGNTPGAAVNGTATFTGFWLYNNEIGLEARDGLVEIAGPPAGTAGVFLAAQTNAAYDAAPHETIEASRQYGLLASTGGMPKPAAASAKGEYPVVNASFPVIFHTGRLAANPIGVLVLGDSVVTIDHGWISDNYDIGALVATLPVAGTTSLTASSVYVERNHRGVDTETGNTTLTDSFVNNNVEIGVLHNAGVGPGGFPYTTTINSGRVNGNDQGVVQNVGNVVIRPSALNAAGSEIADNARQGVLSRGVSTISITTANILRNGAGYETADGEASCVSHTYGVEIDPAAVMTMVTSHVDSNHGGGVLVASASADNSISGGTVNGNGVGTTKDCSFEANEDAYSGVAVAAGGSLKLGDVVTLVDSNRDDGYVVAGTLTSAGTNGIEAKANGKSGVKSFTDTGVVNITSGGTIDSNCAALEKEPNAGITNLGSLTVDTKTLNITNNKCDGVYVETAGNTTVALAYIDHNTGDGVNARRTWAGGKAFQADDAAVSDWGLKVSFSMITNNSGVAGVYLQGGAGYYRTKGDVLGLVSDSSVGMNVVGVYAAKGATTYRTGITLLANRQIILNTSAGVIIDSAYVEDAFTALTLGSPEQFFPGIVQNFIGHNGYPAGDTLCTTGQTAAQIIFSGAAPGGVAGFCATAANGTTCSSDPLYVAAHCVMTGTSGCQRGYQLNGHERQCPQANTIAGYQNLKTPQQGDTTVGLFATNGAFVNITGNTWGSGTPRDGTDFFSSSTGSIAPSENIETCGVENRCTIWNPNPTF